MLGSPYAASLDKGSCPREVVVSWLSMPHALPTSPQDKGSSPREVVVSWLSMALRVNEERTRLGEAGKSLNPAHLVCGEAAIDRWTRDEGGAIGERCHHRGDVDHCWARSKADSLVAVVPLMLRNCLFFTNPGACV